MLNAAGLAAFGGTPDGNGGYNVNIPPGTEREHARADEAVSCPNADPNTTRYNYVQSEISTKTILSGLCGGLQRQRQYKAVRTLQPAAGDAVVSVAFVANGTQVRIRHRSRQEQFRLHIGIADHVFSPTMTNEFVFGYTLVKFQISLPIRRP